MILDENVEIERAMNEAVYFRGGRIVRVRQFVTHAEALDAVAQQRGAKR